MAGTTAVADPIEPSDFRAPVVETFEGLVDLGYPDPFGPLAGEDAFPGPLTYNHVTYSTDNGEFNYASFNPTCCIGPVAGSFGAALGNQTDLGYFDVVFDRAVSKAGGWVGVSAGPVEFFGSDGTLLGTVAASS
jgi:hypothetical protein